MRRIRLAVSSVLLLSSVTHSAHANPVVWLPVLPLQPLTATYVSAFSNGNFYAHNTGVATVFMSRDFGVTWELRDPPPNASGGIFEMLDASTGFFVPAGVYSESHNVYRTGDGAASWNRTAPLPVPDPAWDQGTTLGSVLHIRSLNTSRLGGLVAVGSMLFRADHHFPCSSNGYVLQGESRAALHLSLDNGQTWATTIFPIEGPGTRHVDKIDFLDPEHGVVLITDHTKATNPGDPCNSGWQSSNQHVFITDDGGVSWTETPLPFTYRPRIATAVAMASTERVLLGMNDGSTFVSQDGGETFHEGQALVESLPTHVLFQPEVYWVNAFDFANENVGYASTKGGGTWKTRDGGLTWTQELSPERTETLGIGDIATADEEHAITGGPNFVTVRRPL